MSCTPTTAEDTRSRRNSAGAILWWYHGVLPFPIKKDILSKIKYRRAQKYLAVSRHVLEVLLQSGIPKGKISVVYDAVERRELVSDNAVVASHSAGEPLRVLTPQIDDPLKRSDLVQKACKNLGAQVILSTDLKRDMDRADVFAYLSESEGLGSAVLLAMAHKKPVIASRVGGLPEIVIDELTGLLVDNDAESLTAAISRMSQDAELAAGCVDRAFQRILDRFTDDIMVRAHGRSLSICPCAHPHQSCDLSPDLRLGACFPGWPAAGELSQRLYLSLATRRVGGAAEVPLPVLREDDSVVRQRPGI